MPREVHFPLILVLCAVVVVLSVAGATYAAGAGGGSVGVDGLGEDEGDGEGTGVSISGDPVDAVVDNVPCVSASCPQDDPTKVADCWPDCEPNDRCTSGYDSGWVKRAGGIGYLDGYSSNEDRDWIRFNVLRGELVKVEFRPSPETSLNSVTVGWATEGCSLVETKTAGWHETRGPWLYPTMKTLEWTAPASGSEGLMAKSDDRGEYQYWEFSIRQTDPGSNPDAGDNQSVATKLDLGPASSLRESYEVTLNSVRDVDPADWFSFQARPGWVNVTITPDCEGRPTFEDTDIDSVLKAVAAPGSDLSFVRLTDEDEGDGCDTQHLSVGPLYMERTVYIGTYLEDGVGASAFQMDIAHDPLPREYIANPGQLTDDAWRTYDRWTGEACSNAPCDIPPQCPTTNGGGVGGVTVPEVPDCL